MAPGESLEGNVVQVLYTNQRVGPALGSALGKCNAFVEGRGEVLAALLLLDQIKRDKGVWRMPWQ
jgi:hypothetical protein